MDKEGAITITLTPPESCLISSKSPRRSSSLGGWRGGGGGCCLQGAQSETKSLSHVAQEEIDLFTLKESDEEEGGESFSKNNLLK